MEIKDRLSSEYEISLKKLLPQGSYWDNLLSENSDLSLILKIRAENLALFRSRMNQLLRESNPMTADETIGDWERICLGETHEDQPLATRRAGLANQVGFKSIYAIAQNAGVRIALDFPYNIGVFGQTKFAQTRCGSQAVFSVLQINVYDGTGLNTEDFEETISKIILANHIPFFIYRPLKSSYDSISELAQACALELDNCTYLPAKFGVAKVGQTRIASTASGDVLYITIPNTTSNCRRFDIEATALNSIKKYQRICFKYNDASFLMLPEANLTGCNSISEIAARIGVDIECSFPFTVAKMGWAKFGHTQCASVEKANTVIVSVSKFNPEFRFESVESAVKEFLDGGLHIYFKYGTEVF